MNTVGVDIVKISNCSSDWSGLYVNGILETQGHQIREMDYIDLIRKYNVFRSVTCFVISDEHMELFGGCLPRNLEDANFKVEDID